MVLFEGASNLGRATVVTEHAERGCKGKPFLFHEAALEAFCERRMDSGIVNPPEHAGGPCDQFSALRLDDCDQGRNQAGIGCIAQGGDEPNSGLERGATVASLDDCVEMANHQVGEVRNSHEQQSALIARQCLDGLEVGLPLPECHDGALDARSEALPLLTLVPGLAALGARKLGSYLCELRAELDVAKLD